MFLAEVFSWVFVAVLWVIPLFGLVVSLLSLLLKLIPYVLSFHYNTFFYRPVE